MRITIVIDTMGDEEFDGEKLQNLENKIWNGITGGSIPALVELDIDRIDINIEG
jgi:hypothetical protein